MNKIMSMILGGFLLATSLNANEKTSQANLEHELDVALNDVISNSKKVNDIIGRFKSKKEFLEASKRILESWERDIDKDLEKIAKEKK